VCVCVSACVRARARARVCVCVCVCGLSYPVGKRMRRIVLPFVACPTLPSLFHTISQTIRFSGGKKKLLNIKRVCWFSLQSLFEMYLILRRIQPDIIINWHRCSVKLFSSDFNQTRIFSTCFRKYSNIKFNKNPSSGNSVVPCGGRTDRHDEAHSRFSQFCERARKKRRSHLWMGCSASYRNRVRFGLLKASALRLTNFTFYPTQRVH
jgi:hypothetical protein